MEIEVLLPINEKHSIGEYVRAHKSFIERISFNASTFQMFLVINDVIDVGKRKFLKKSSALSKVFKAPDARPFTFVICRN
ncbi:hypothetical protein [Foetidibacter luteolus]|uniref:hypothetical protein n=1 Tax=Foetidibacter luteolus TaxID=2608880 RepID=UPI00129A7D19|nr:hypothetical protein [Foetidibacter luteolus]